MLSDNYELAKATMAEYPDEMDFVGSRPFELIAAAESALGVAFPASYKKFVTEFGAGNFAALEIYGVLNEKNLLKPGVPNSVGYTLARREGGLPDEFIVISDVGDGDLICLKLEKDGSRPVVVYAYGAPNAALKQEVIADDFGTWLLEEVKLQISVLGED